MKNVTISMPDETLQKVRVDAAKAGKSVSKYIADMLATVTEIPPRQVETTREAQRAALERILTGPKWDVMRDGRMPTADERNER